MNHDPKLGMCGPAENTDRELWRERDDYYADSIHVTELGGIGINVGGTVVVLAIRAWHALAMKDIKSRREAAEEQTRPTPPCPQCEGKGSSDRGHSLVICPACDGSGEIQGATPEPPTPATCPTCNSTYKEIRRKLYHPTEDALCFDPWHDEAVPQTETAAQNPVEPTGWWVAKSQLPYLMHLHGTSSGAQPPTREQIEEIAGKIFGLSCEAEADRGPEWGVKSIATVIEKELAELRGATQGSSPEKGKYEE